MVVRVQVGGESVMSVSQISSGYKSSVKASVCIGKASDFVFSGHRFNSEPLKPSVIFVSMSYSHMA